MSDFPQPKATFTNRFPRFGGRRAQFLICKFVGVIGDLDVRSTHAAMALVSVQQKAGLVFIFRQIEIASRDQD